MPNITHEGRAGSMFRSGFQFIVLAVSTVLALLLFAGAVQAGNLSNPDFRAKVAAQFEDVSPDEITPSSIEGLWQVISQGQIGYLTADGRYLIEGDVYDLEHSVNLTERARRKARLDTLKAADPDNMIIYKATDRPNDPKQTLVIFTDVDCLYCRHLHANIEQLQNAGIEVRYMAFPLTGPKSESFHKAEQVWCADNRKQALTRAMAGKPIHSKADCDAPVLAQYKLAGIEMSLNATPAIIAGNGQLLPGGMPIDELIDKVRQIDTTDG